MDGLLGGLQIVVGVLVGRGIVIAVVIGKVAAADIQPEAMPRQERIRRWIHADVVLDHLTRLDQAGLIQSLTIPGTHHAE